MKVQSAIIKTKRIQASNIDLERDKKTLAFTHFVSI